jgi:hypothetical protein
MLPLQAVQDRAPNALLGVGRKRARLAWIEFVGSVVQRENTRGHQVVELRLPANVLADSRRYCFHQWKISNQYIGPRTLSDPGSHLIAPFFHPSNSSGPCGSKSIHRNLDSFLDEVNYLFHGGHFTGFGWCNLIRPAKEHWRGSEAPQLLWRFFGVTCDVQDSGAFRTVFSS